MIWKNILIIKIILFYIICPAISLTLVLKFLHLTFGKVLQFLPVCKSRLVFRSIFTSQNLDLYTGKYGMSAIVLVNDRSLSTVNFVNACKSLFSITKSEKCAV